MISRLLLLVCAGVGGWAAAGCGVVLFNQPPDELRLVGRDVANVADAVPQAAVSPASFGSVLYRYEDPTTLTVLLFDGPAEEPTRVAILSMFWRPRAGSTPVDRTATNTVIRYLDLSTAGPVDAALGVYAGAGFMRVYADPAGVEIDGTLFDADLRLTDRSDAFNDTLGRSTLAGSFTAQRDDARVTMILSRLNLRVSETLGYPRLVQKPTDRSSVTPGQS